MEIDPKKYYSQYEVTTYKLLGELSSRYWQGELREKGLLKDSPLMDGDEIVKHRYLGSDLIKFNSMRKK